MQSGDFRRCQSTNRSRPPDTQRAVVGSRRVSATMHKCATCGRAFTRRPNLQRNASGCRPTPFVCDVCRRSFTRERDLDRHKRTVQCGGPPQPGPAPKRRKVTHLQEDPVLAPPVEHAANDELSSAIRDFVHENWAAIRTHVVNGPVQTRYNRRLTSLDTRDLHDQLFLLFDQQTTAFKINCSFGFILKNKTTGRFRYYHSSNNCCGRYLEEPSLVTNWQTFNAFLERIREPDILQWAIAQRSNSDWVCELVTNVTFFLNRIVQHPIGGVGVNLPDYVKHNKAIVGLEKDRYRMTTYNDNICLFQCLALHQGCDVRHLEATVVTLYTKYTDTSVHDFAGVTIDDLSKIEATFGVNVVVYKLDERTDGTTTAELVRRSTGCGKTTMYVNLHESHYSYIQDIGKYCHSYRCRKCGDSYGNGLGSCTVMKARVRPASTGYTKEACTGRRRHYSNSWMMRASLFPRCCDTFHTGPRLTSSVTSAMSDYQSTATNFNGRHDTCH